MQQTSLQIIPKAVRGHSSRRMAKPGFRRPFLFLPNSKIMRKPATRLKQSSLRHQRSRTVPTHEVYTSGLQIPSKTYVKHALYTLLVMVEPRVQSRPKPGMMSAQRNLVAHSKAIMQAITHRTHQYMQVKRPEDYAPDRGLGA